MSAPWDYKVLIDDLEPNAPCKCGSCEWSGVFDDLDEIKDCSLTPGDASPAGRCPECESLVYPSRELDRARDSGPETLAALRAAVAFEGGQYESSARSDITPPQWLIEAREAIARIDGRAS